MKDKHTPGPWTVSPMGSIESEGGFIGEAYDMTLGYDSQEPEDLPMMANARLMAAAPEMLEFLRDAMGLIYGFIVDSDGQTKFQEDEKQKIAATLLRDGLDILTKIEGNINEK